MAILKRAHNELFHRTPDECFDSFEALHHNCCNHREDSVDQWIRPQDIIVTHDLTLCCDGEEYSLNEWSFSQLCRMSGVSKDTINRLSTKTASKAFEETLPVADKPLQLLSCDNQIRSVHGVAYTRLWNADLLDVVQEFTSEFTPPQKAMDGTSTGLYCGEQDMFAFMIDPTGWAEINGEAFAPASFSGTQKSAAAHWGSRHSGFRRSARTTLSGTRLKSSSSNASTLPTCVMDWTTSADHRESGHQT